MISDETKLNEKMLPIHISSIHSSILHGVLMSSGLLKPFSLHPGLHAHKLIFPEVFVFSFSV
jgi:hypothetical protein